MDEEEILDREIAPISKAPIWPYLLLGGIAAGAVKLLFAFFAPHTTVSLGAILLVMLSMIMMNTTLNFYYQKKHPARDLRTAVIICIGIYLLMQVISRGGLYLMGRGHYYDFFDNWQLDIPVTLGAGVVISVLVAILSRKAE